MLAVFLLLLGSSYGGQDVTKDGINTIKDDVKDETVFTLTVSEPHVKGVANAPFNFTVSIDATEWVGEEVEVYWESTGYPVTPRDELGNKIIFTKTGSANHLVQVESDLIGIFLLRLVLLLPKHSSALCSDSSGLIPLGKRCS